VKWQKTCKLIFPTAIRFTKFVILIGYLYESNPFEALEEKVSTTNL